MFSFLGLASDFFLLVLPFSVELISNMCLCYCAVNACPGGVLAH